MIAVSEQRPSFKHLTGEQKSERARRIVNIYAKVLRGTLSRESFYQQRSAINVQYSIFQPEAVKLGDTVENSVSCCPQCNYSKRGMPENEFRQWTMALSKNLREKILVNSAFTALLVNN